MSIALAPQVKVTVNKPKPDMYVQINGFDRINSTWKSDDYEFNFKSKADYLHWRKIWKDTYKELATEIKRLKQDRSSHYKHWSNLLNVKLAFKEDRHILESGAKCAALAISKGVRATVLLDILHKAKALSYEMKRRANA